MFMAFDHDAIDSLLTASLASGDVDRESYALLRDRLLRHIALEEKVLLPLVRAYRGAPFPTSKQLRVDHGAIARLLVPTPSVPLLRELEALLATHDALEEGPDSLYAVCDACADGYASEVLDQLRRYPKVPVARHYDGPLVHARRG
jgi:hypothetical protein